MNLLGPSAFVMNCLVLVLCVGTIWIFTLMSIAMYGMWRDQRMEEAKEKARGKVITATVTLVKENPRKFIVLSSGRKIEYWGPFTNYPNHVEISEIAGNGYDPLSVDDLEELGNKLIRMAMEMRHGRTAFRAKEKV